MNKFDGSNGRGCCLRCNGFNGDAQIEGRPLAEKKPTAFEERSNVLAPGAAGRLYFPPWTYTGTARRRTIVVERVSATESRRGLWPVLVVPPRLAGPLQLASQFDERDPGNTDDDRINIDGGNTAAEPSPLTARRDLHKAASAHNEQQRLAHVP